MTLQSNPGHDVPVPDLAGTSMPVSDDSKKVSHEHINLVHSLIERCLLLNMNRNEVVAILRSQAKIVPRFTSLVWQKLEEENAEFFRAYYTRLKLEKQILLFNNLLEHQHHLMTYPATPNVPLATLPMQNGIPSLPVNNIPLGYPVMHHPAMPATGQPHLDSIGLSGPVQVNLGNDAGSSKDTLRSGRQLPWNFSLTDLTADLKKLEDLGAPGNDTGSLFLHGSDLWLNADADDIVDD